jgi:Flp pilus assembly protein TadD
LYTCRACRASSFPCVSPDSRNQSSSAPITHASISRTSCPRPATPATGWTGDAATRPAHAGYDEALTDFDRAIELNPADLLSIGKRGEVYQATGRYDDALTDFNRAIELNPRAGRG